MTARIAFYSNIPQTAVISRQDAVRLLVQLRSKGFWYWSRVLVLGLLVGSYVGQWLGHFDFWIPARYWVYQGMHGLVERKPAPPGTVIVLIEDEDYWKGPLGRRVPIKRDYLARVVRALGAGNPSVIALDFDLRSPVPDGTLIEHGDYLAETKKFLDTVKEVSRKDVPGSPTVVLPRTLSRIGDGYVLDSTIFDDFDFGQGKIRFGYITLPYDVRQVALQQPLLDGSVAESFAEAIVGSVNAGALQELGQNGSLPFGSYIPAGGFNKLSAGTVLNTEPESLAEVISHRIVIVGGGWRRLAYGRGELADANLTPVGTVPGVFVHANYVEAILSHHVYDSWNQQVLAVFELTLVVVIGAVFALPLGSKSKVVILTVLVIVPIGLAYVSLQNFGLFFDPLVPLPVVFAKFSLEQIAEWRRRARENTNP